MFIFFRLSILNTNSRTVFKKMYFCIFSILLKLLYIRKNLTSLNHFFSKTVPKHFSLTSIRMCVMTWFNNSNSQRAHRPE